MPIQSKSFRSYHSYREEGKGQGGDFEKQSEKSARGHGGGTRLILGREGPARRVGHLLNRELTAILYGSINSGGC